MISKKLRPGKIESEKRIPNIKGPLALFKRNNKNQKIVAKKKINFHLNDKFNFLNKKRNTKLKREKPKMLNTTIYPCDSSYLNLYKLMRSNDNNKLMFLKMINM